VRSRGAVGRPSDARPCYSTGNDSNEGQDPSPDSPYRPSDERYLDVNCHRRRDYSRSGFSSGSRTAGLLSVGVLFWFSYSRSGFSVGVLGSRVLGVLKLHRGIPERIDSIYGARLEQRLKSLQAIVTYELRFTCRDW